MLFFEDAIGLLSPWGGIFLSNFDVVAAVAIAIGSPAQSFLLPETPHYDREIETGIGRMFLQPAIYSIRSEVAVYHSAL